MSTLGVRAGFRSAVLEYRCRAVLACLALARAQGGRPGRDGLRARFHSRPCPRRRSRLAAPVYAVEGCYAASMAKRKLSPAFKKNAALVKAGKPPLKKSTAAKKKK